jgi:DNA-binding GntR family transcriptional regulator
MLERQAAPLREQVVSAIRTGIVDATFLPGTRLKEKALCETYEVSRTVIREALRQLESEKLVHLESNVGPVVSELTVLDAKNLYEARGALEATAARLAASSASAEELEAIGAVFDEIVRADPAELSGLIALKNSFYNALMTACGNQVIAEMFSNIQARTNQLRRMTLSDPGRHQATIRELTAVVEAILRRDSEGAYAAAFAHVRSAGDLAMRKFHTNDNEDDRA